ncbi:MAG: DUF3574 domain-containing protein [Roseiflexaceae bacterium]|nr:DUF3574 domain-containing protein [Roseiflexaceae bacterium]
MTPTKQRFVRYAGIALLALALLLLGTGMAAYVPVANSQAATATPASDTYARQQPIVAATPSVDTEQALEATGKLATEPFIRSELFFGSERPNKPEVSKAEFKKFLDTEVTPRFPDGLTLLTGFGQFREASGETVQETSFVLILLYPKETAKDSSAKIEEIRTLYIEQFEQESVLRIDDPRPVRVSF